MKSHPSLRDLQLWLKWIVTDPRGVTDALNDPMPNVERYKSRYTRPTPSYLGLIVSDSVRSVNRIDVYAEGYFSRIFECMTKDFSRTKRVVGEETFTKIVAEYLKAHPSKFISIDEVGSRFAEFLSKCEETSLQGWVSDLARFEWTWIESFYAREIQIDGNWRNEIASSPLACVMLHPSVHFIQSSWPIGKLIRDLDSGSEMNFNSYDQGLPSAVIIFRFNDEIYWEELELPVFQILQSLKMGVSLEEALSKVKGLDSETISLSFSGWVEKGIICGILKDKKEIRNEDL